MLINKRETNEKKKYYEKNTTMEHLEALTGGHTR